MKKKTCYVANDNSEHPTELACRERDASLFGLTFVCPACNGVGTQNGDPIHEERLDEEATAWGGQFARDVYRDVLVGYKKVSCDACNGHGWTATKKVAITEKKVIGWQ